jgi:hypothetical protein
MAYHKSSLFTAITLVKKRRIKNKRSGHGNIFFSLFVIFFFFFIYFYFGGLTVRGKRHKPVKLRLLGAENDDRRLCAGSKVARWFIF